MRILIYGFGPYHQFRDNVTEKIVRALPKRRGLKKIVFPVRFHKGQFTGAVEQFRPDVILGLGQCSTGRVLRIETRAVNRLRNTKNEQPKPIVRAGSPELYPDLQLDLAGRARMSRDAGDYVCNFSMYVMLDHIKRLRLPILYGFVHVPCRYDQKLAQRALRGAMDRSKFRTGRQIRRRQH